MFEKLSRKIGFTAAEVKVLFFLISVFIVGLSYKLYKFHAGASDYVNYDYSAEERLFYRLNDNEKEQTGDSAIDKNIDSKQEVLDFNSSKFEKKDVSKLPGRKSINVNTAGKEDLIILPGIGKKTAQKIIDLRNKKGRFNRLEELLEVKGIGKTRFNKIEKFLYIEQSNFFKAPEEK